MRRLVWMTGIAVCLMLIAVVAPVLGQSGYPERVDPYINDYKGLMSAPLEAKLRGWLTDLKTQYHIDMTVVTINSIRDYKTSDYQTSDSSIEAFATHVFNRWGIGDRATNKGVMLLVARSDRKVRIELGAGYDSSYNSRAMDVINEYILPSFKKDNYEAGIEKGVRGTIFMLTGAWPTGGTPTFLEQVSDQVARVDPMAWLIGIGVIVLGAGGSVLYRESHRCPQCRVIGLDIQSTVLTRPTHYSEGEKEVHKYCPNCQYKNTQVVRIGRLRDYSTSDGSGRSGGSGSSGGGRSSGGGATGSW